MNDLLSVNQIAKQLKTDPFRVAYAMRKCLIEPAERVGNVRLYRAKQLDAIRSAIKAVRKKSA